jgi:hypothetical protein
MATVLWCLRALASVVNGMVLPGTSTAVHYDLCNVRNQRAGVYCLYGLCHQIVNKWRPYDKAKSLLEKLKLREYDRIASASLIVLQDATGRSVALCSELRFPDVGYWNHANAAGECSQRARCRHSSQPAQRVEFLESTLLQSVNKGKVAY